MEKRKDGISKRQGGRKPIDDKIQRYFEASVDGVAHDFPIQLRLLVTYGLMKGAVPILRDLLKKGEITWKEPFAQLEYKYFPFYPGWPSENLDFKDYREMVALATLNAVTRAVFIHENRIYHRPNVPEEVKEANEKLPEEELAAGFELPPLPVMVAIDTPEGPQVARVALCFAIRPLTIEGDRETGRAFYPLHVGLTILEGDPASWPEEWQDEIWGAFTAALDASITPNLEALEATGQERPPIPEPDRVKPIHLSPFAVPGGYVRPIFGLSKAKKDLPLLLEFHEPQTPLNWAVGLAMFSLTDEDRIRAGVWQEASIQEIEDRVFRLTERDAPRRGDHREDILAEVVKLATTHNWYYEIETVRVGRAWTKRATIGVRTAVPELLLQYIDIKTGNVVSPADPALRKFRIPLEVKGRRVIKPDGKDIPALPKDQWKLESIRWRWVQSFNDDLLLTPALHEDGKRKGLPKKTTTGKAIRKGYLIKVADNIFNALGKLRAEGSGQKYACRLLIMLASNMNKTEDGIAADRVFRMLGIPEDYQATGHRKPEDLVAQAVLRLKERDIRALLVGSDEYPRIDPNPERRKGPYYCFKRSAEYTPRAGIVSKEDAQAIEAEYEPTPAPTPEPTPKGKDDQAALPGIIEDAPPIPSGADIRAAREAAGVNLRDFARIMDGPAFKTWSNYETGKPIRVGSIAPEVWNRVRDFIKQHGGKGDT